MLKRVSSTMRRSVAALLVLITAAAAQAGPVFPYQGRLDRNGSPQSGTYDFKFSLFNMQSGGTAQWSDTLSGVVVVNGAFSVKLGAGVSIPDVLLTEPQLFLELEVKGATEGAFRKLVGRQQLLHVPYAATSSGTFRVNGPLVVAATLDGGSLITDGGYAEVVHGPLQVNTQSPVAQLTVNGRTVQSSTTLQLQPNAQPTQVGGTLAVTGETTASRFRPQYDSGWFLVTNTSGDITKNHGLGALPASYMLQQCGGTPVNVFGNFDPFNGKCPTRVLMTVSGYHDGTQVNPETISVDETNFLIPILSSWWVYNYWTNAKGWNCPVADCFTGYYRLQAWR